MSDGFSESSQEHDTAPLPGAPEGHLLPWEGRGPWTQVGPSLDASGRRLHSSRPRGPHPDDGMASPLFRASPGLSEWVSQPSLGAPIIHGSSR